MLKNHTYLVRFSYSILFVSVALMFAGCGLQNKTSLRQDAVIYARGDDAITLDPGSMEEGFSVNTALQIYEGLVRFKDDSLDVEPCLATSWETSDDKLIWTFHLRDDVQFHDGTPFTAEAVETSFMRIINPDHPYHIPGQMPYADFAYKGIIKDVRAIDDQIVEIELFEPYAPLLKNLAMFCCYIVSPTALEKHGGDIGSHPSGTGPFMLESWQRDVEIVLKRYKNYWDEPAASERVIYKVIRDPDVRLFALSRGEAHILEGAEPQMIQQIEQNPDIKLLSRDGVNISFAYMNTKREPFDDKRVRQAVNYAVNKEAICEYLFGGLAIPCRGIYAPGILGYDPESDAYQYNPEKAKHLLAEAGYEDGLSFEILTYSVPRPYNPMGAQLAEAIQADLAEVGINANIVQMDWGTHLQRTLNHNFQMAMLGWMTDNGDPDNFAYALLAQPENRSQFENEEFNRLVKQGQQTYDEAERLKIYRQAQDIALEEAPWLFINHFQILGVVRKEVEGFKLHPSSAHPLWNVRLKIPETEATE